MLPISNIECVSHLINALEKILRPGVALCAGVTPLTKEYKI
jgi:hypothetical protein